MIGPAAHDIYHLKYIWQMVCLMVSNLAATMAGAFWVVMASEGGMTLSDTGMILLWCFIVGGFSALAVLLKSDNVKITFRRATGALLYNGLSGLTIGLLWLNFMEKHGYVAIALSGLLGLSVIQLAPLANTLLKVLAGIKIEKEDNRCEKNEDDNAK